MGCCTLFTLSSGSMDIPNVMLTYESVFEDNEARRFWSGSFVDHPVRRIEEVCVVVNAPSNSNEEEDAWLSQSGVSAAEADQ